MIRNIYIASDHAGLSYKKEIVNYLLGKEYLVHNCGVSSEETVAYPTYAMKICKSVVQHHFAFGILICGTGIGMSMVANRFQGIRAAVCTTEYHAEAARMHNDANIICLGERILGLALSLRIVDVFLATEFEQDRHAERIALFNTLGEK
ncbi:MAG: ribose 5-phosphate isomerase B [Desulfovibrionaceae bacterium]